MNEVALLTLLKAKIQSLTWDGTNPLFHTNSVVITVAPDKDALSKFIMPVCLIHPGTKVADREQPSLYLEEIEMVIMVSIPGDAMGSNALMGANRVTDTSKGAGLLTIEQAVLDAISFMNAREGLVIKHVFSGATSPAQLNETTWINFRKLRFEAKINSSPSPVI